MKWNISEPAREFREANQNQLTIEAATERGRQLASIDNRIVVNHRRRGIRCIAAVRVLRRTRTVSQSA